VSIDDEIINIKRELEAIKVRKIQTDTKLKSLEEEKAKLLTECEALGVQPKGIDDAIRQQEELIEKEVREIKEQLDQFHVARA
jgi:predicted  nucleic acid-binding Zn-ribbon protein